MPDSTTTGSERICVCSWSLHPANPGELAERLEELGIPRTQLALDPLINDPGIWGEAPAFLRSKGIEVVSGMFGCAGEDYSSLESIRRTGGLAPDATWEENRQHAVQAARLARSLGLSLVTFHAGFVPHEETAPGYTTLLSRLAETARIFFGEGIHLGLETGQETASSLAALLESLASPNLGVNFDPANMILYDKGDPVEAVGILGGWIRQVHIKDAVKTRVPGTWGQEAPAGEGDVNWPAFFGALRKQGFRGKLVIEREAGARRVEDIRTAKALIESHL